MKWGDKIKRWAKRHKLLVSILQIILIIIGLVAGYFILVIFFLIVGNIWLWFFPKEEPGRLIRAWHRPSPVRRAAPIREQPIIPGKWKMVERFEKSGYPASQGITDFHKLMTERAARKLY